MLLIRLIGLYFFAQPSVCQYSHSCPCQHSFFYTILVQSAKVLQHVPGKRIAIPLPEVSMEGDNMPE